MKEVLFILSVPAHGCPCLHRWRVGWSDPNGELVTVCGSRLPATTQPQHDAEATVRQCKKCQRYAAGGAA